MLFSKILKNSVVQLMIGLLVGILIGPFLTFTTLQILLSVKHFLGQLIIFLVPLIILAFIIPSICKLEQNSSKIIITSLLIAYISSIGAGLFSTVIGYKILPYISIPELSNGTKIIPEILFKLDIPPIFNTMTALVLALLLGMGILWVKSKILETAFDNLKEIVLELVKKILLPILPVYIASNFAILSYQGTIQHQLPLFLKVIVIVIVMHILWLIILYTIAGIYAKENPWEVLKHYGKTYLTALGTMSSAACLAVALEAAHKSKVLKPEVSNFTIPLFSNVHLCGAMVTESFFVLVTSLVLYNELPQYSVMIIFVLLLGVFALGAPGVPGGTLLASLGLISQLLHFDDTGIALILTIFALQDSFGTACNIVGDGALSLIISSYHSKTNKKSLPE